MKYSSFENLLNAAITNLKITLRGWRVASALAALAEGPVWCPAPTQCGSQPPIIPVPEI